MADFTLDNIHVFSSHYYFEKKKSKQEEAVFLVDGFPRNLDNLEGWNKEVGSEYVVLSSSSSSSSSSSISSFIVVVVSVVAAVFV